MFAINNDDLMISVTRGDTAYFKVSLECDGEPYNFQAGDIVRIKVFGKKDCENVVLQKDFPIVHASETVEIVLEEEDTKIGEVINKQTDYWYEIELNPETDPQTIIGYDDNGAKVFKLYPEGDDVVVVKPDIKPEDIPIIDAHLDLTSKRPIENQAVARGIEQIRTATLNGINQVRTDAEIWKQEVLASVLDYNYPVGSVYVSSTNTNPAATLGGTWELVDKEFTPKLDNITFDALENKTGYNTLCSGQLDKMTVICQRVGHTVRLRVQCYLKASTYYSDATVQLANFNFNDFGFTELPCGYFDKLCYADNLNDKGFLVSLSQTGTLNHKDIIGGTLTAPEGSTFYFDITSTISKSAMLDSFCGKFYWKRTA